VILVAERSIAANAEADDAVRRGIVTATPMTSALVPASTRTVVLADGMEPSAGSVWLNASVAGADIHAASSRTPSTLSESGNAPTGNTGGSIS
jgi:hypothetical protein